MLQIAVHEAKHLQAPTTRLASTLNYQKNIPRVTVYGISPLTLEQQAAHDWKLENWPRCEHDDFFDMCLACITHRQANDLVN
jgi:hypothetical protein